jgi:hypothetical protein
MIKAITNSKGVVDYVEMTAEEETNFFALLAINVITWTYPERTIRVSLTDEQYVSMLVDYPEFAVLRQQLGIPVESNNMGGEYLYLEELHDEDRSLFEYFGGGANCIENNPL